MNERPIPLRPAYAEAARIERRSWSRALAASALSSPQRGSAEKILARNWPHDSRADMILKSAVSPASMTNTGLPPHDVTGMFRSLAPGSAMWRLLDHPSAMRLDLSGLHQINVPHVGSLPTQPIFVGEGMPAPSLQLAFVKSALGPARKILVLSAVSEELQDASPQNASQVIARILSDATNRSIDVIAFDSNPADAIRPAGLLNGVTATPAAAAGPTLQDTIATDLSNLVGAIGAAGIDPSDTVFVAGPREASLIQSLTESDAIMSLGVPAKTLIAVAPAGLASAYQGAPSVETGKHGSWQFADSNPQEIVSSGGAVAAPPVISAFQSYLIGIKVRADAAWCAAPGSAQTITGVNW